MTKKEIEIELKEVVKFNQVSTDKVKRIYNLNKVLFNDNSNYCTKCPSVIRNVFNKIKLYYKNNY